MMGAGAAFANPFRLRNGDAEGYAKGVAVAMFAGTRYHLTQVD